MSRRVSKPPCKVRRTTTTRRGRKPVHSWEKLVCVCLIMVVMGWTFREAQNYVPNLDLLRTRIRRDDNRGRWGTILTTGWNLKVLNRLRCTRSLGMEVMPIGRN